MSEVNTWSTTSANNTSSPPDGWPEGMQYSGVNNCGREMMGAVARINADLNGSLTTGGVANVYTLTPNRTIASYTTNLEFLFKLNLANTGASTLNVSALGAKNLKTTEGSDPVSGALKAGAYYHVRYDGTNFVIFDQLIIDAVNNTSVFYGATANAVKTAYDEAIDAGLVAAAAAVDTTVVHKAGAEAITGVKTFNAGAEPVSLNFCKAWVRFNGATGAIASAYNVSSVTRNSSGDFTINFGTAMADDDYAWAGSGQRTGSGIVSVNEHPSIVPTTAALRIVTNHIIGGGSIGAVDVMTNVHVFGN